MQHKIVADSRLPNGYKEGLRLDRGALLWKMVEISDLIAYHRGTKKDAVTILWYLLPTTDTHPMNSASSRY